MSKPTTYTDLRLAPTPLVTKSVRTRVTLAIGGGAAPAPASPVSVWDGTAWVSTGVTVGT